MRRLSPLLAKQPSLTPQGFQNTAQGRGSAPWERRQPPAGSTRNGLDLAGPALCNPCGVGSGWDGFASAATLGCAVQPLRGEYAQAHFSSFPGCGAATLGCAVQPLRGEYVHARFSSKTISECLDSRQSCYRLVYSDGTFP